MLDTNRSPLPDMTDALKQVQQFDEKKTDKPKRWQDDDGDGKWYEKSDVDGKISKREKEEKKKNQKEEVETTEGKKIKVVKSRTTTSDNASTTTSRPDKGGCDA